MAKVTYIQGKGDLSDFNFGLGSYLLVFYELTCSCTVGSPEPMASARLKHRVVRQAVDSEGGFSAAERRSRRSRVWGKKNLNLIREASPAVKLCSKIV